MKWFIEYSNRIIKENYRVNLTTSLRVNYITKIRNLKRWQSLLCFPRFLLAG